MKADRIKSGGICAKTAAMGIAAALVAALSWLDTLISPVLIIPGVRLGLANLIIILALKNVGILPAALLAAMRSAFVLLTRGVTAGLMSFSGGALSFAAAALLICVFKRRLKFSSAAAAICHIIGQLAAFSLMMKSPYALMYAPLLVAAAVLTGLLTGTLADALEKALHRSSFGKD